MRMAAKGAVVGIFGVGAAVAAVGSGPLLAVAAGTGLAVQSVTGLAACGALAGAGSGAMAANPDSDATKAAMAAGVGAAAVGANNYNSASSTERNDAGKSEAEKARSFCNSSYENSKEMSESSNLNEGLDGSQKGFGVGSDNWKLDTSTSLSDNEHQIWVNRFLNLVIFVARGSHTNADWYNTNAALVAGNLETTQRFRKAQRCFDAMLRKYSNLQKRTTGHSPGGAIAQALSNQQSGVSYIVFNPASTGSPGSDEDHVYRISGDWVSFFSPKAVAQDNRAQVHTSQSNGKSDPGNAHSLDSFSKCNLR